MIYPSFVLLYRARVYYIEMKIVLRLDLKGPRMIQRFTLQKTIARIQVRAIHKIKYIREISREIYADR